MKKEQKQTYRRIAGQNGWRKGRKRRYLRSLSLLAVLLPAAVIFGSAAVRFRPYVVLSGSMEPALQVGSVVWVDVRKTEAGIGDAVTFERDGRTVTHRIVGKTEKGYLTKETPTGRQTAARWNPEKWLERLCSTCLIWAMESFGCSDTGFSFWAEEVQCWQYFSAPGRKGPEKQQEKKKNEQFRWPAAAEKTGKRERSKTYEEKKNSGNDRSRNPVYTSDSGKYSGLSHRQR